MSVDVECCVCGKVLRGQPTLVGGFLVRPHRGGTRVHRAGPVAMNDPTQCPGTRRFDHQQLHQPAHA